TGACGRARSDRCRTRALTRTVIGDRSHSSGGRPPDDRPRSAMTTTESTAGAEARTGFHSLSAGGLNWKSLPLQLFARGNSLTWNPATIDFSADAEHWRALSDEQRRSATYLCAQFIAGEEAVTQDL